MKCWMWSLPAVAIAGCLASCAGGGGNDLSEAPSKEQVEGFRLKSGAGGDDDSDSLEKRFATTYKDALKQKSGKTVAEFDRNKKQPFGGQFNGTKRYASNEVSRPAFWGSKEYERKVFAGNTDGSRFQKESSLAGVGAREAESGWSEAGKDYATGSYRTGKSSEMDRRGVDVTSDAETDERRRVFTQPEIIPWKEQRALSVGDTRRMLGRD